jgi:hypothetical protein
MDNFSQSSPPSTGTAAPAPLARRPRGTRLPSTRASAVLATAMLGIGIAVGAAVGPGPEASLAGGLGVAQKLPALLAGVAAHNRAQAPAPAATTTTAPPAIEAQATPAATPTTAESAPATTTPAAAAPTETSAPATKTTKPSSSSNVPPITSVWLIELNGTSFAEALASPTAAPSITGELLPKGTYLPAWSALSAAGFASDAALVEHRASLGTTPPLLHTIVQPSCPEGTAGAACAAGTPAGVSSADAFLKATLATITATTTYSEHGLVVVTFATVSDPTAAELPAGSSSATLASQPPAGAVLLSPFAKAGVKSSAAFDPTSPKQSLEKLLH